LPTTVTCLAPFRKRVMAVVKPETPAPNQSTALVMLSQVPSRSKLITENNNVFKGWHVIWERKREKKPVYQSFLTFILFSPCGIWKWNNGSKPGEGQKRYICISATNPRLQPMKVGGRSLQSIIFFSDKDGGFVFFSLLSLLLFSATCFSATPFVNYNYNLLRLLL
jgi:hypothetical protein